MPHLTFADVVEKGGITGRGVLIDYAEWAERNNVKLEHFESTPIPLADLKKIVKENNIEIRQGDIIFIRSGWIPAYVTLSDSARAAVPERPAPNFIGVEAGEETLKWLWSLQPSAVAGDQPGFERCPLAGPHHDPQFILHEWLLAGWGMPIGEMFDLEALSKECKKQGRYSFFVSSMHLKVCCSACRFVLDAETCRFRTVLRVRRMLSPSSRPAARRWWR